MLALVTMLVLTITLSTVMFMTAAGARDAHRSNAGQKASALAESGLNNALAVLNANYPGIVAYPGDPNLLPSRTTTYPTGTATWSGVMETAPTTASWNDQWRITSVGTVANPTGPSASPVTRTTTAIVPIVIPETVSVNPTTSSLNWVYAYNDVEFGQSVTVRSPVYANRDLRLEQHVEDRGDDSGQRFGASAPEQGGGRPKSVPGEPAEHRSATLRPRSERWEPIEARSTFRESARSKSTTPPPACGWGAVDDVWGNTTGSVIPTGFITVPSLTCCSPYLGSTGHPELSTRPERHGLLVPQRLDRAELALRDVERRVPEVRPTRPGADGPDGSINQSATAGRPPFDLTGATYTCKTGQGELSYNASTKKLTINGSIFIDGSATSTANDATYVGQGALILSGTFSMDNQDKLCVKLTGSGDCDTTAPWDPNLSGMFIFAAGDFGTELSTDSGTAGNGIEIKKGQYQGGLFAANKIDATVTGTVVQGPMVSAYGDVATGQGGELSFPSISFPTSGSSGFTGPLPLPRLLAPRNFGGG